MQLRFDPWSERLEAAELAELAKARGIAVDLIEERKIASWNPPVMFSIADVVAALSAAKGKVRV